MMSQEWFNAQSEAKQKELMEHSEAISARIKAIIALSHPNDPELQLLASLATESFMTDVHAAIRCGVGKTFIQIAHLVASDFLRQLELALAEAQASPSPEKPIRKDVH